MSLAKNVVTRDAFGSFKSKREEIVLAFQGLIGGNDGEEDNEDDGECAQQVWSQTTFLIDEGGDKRLHARVCC